jgi:putative two-component system response regulator
MRKIAIVEDEAPLLKAMSLELMGKEFVVVSASRGKAGLELIKAELPDIVLLDIMLPEISGFEVLEALKKEDATKHIPVIMLTNLGQDSDREKAKTLGALDYFVKSSTDLTELTNKIRAIVSP